MLELRPGDIFCSTSIGNGDQWRHKLLASAIRKFSAMRADDGQAFYTHSGNILNQYGDTFEARWQYGIYSLNDYIGSPLLIGRPVSMSERAHYQGLLKILKYNGRSYPFMRLLLFVLPGRFFTDISITGLPVCSELVCMKNLGSGIRAIGKWQGQTPDNVADQIKKWDAFKVIYEGPNWPGIPAAT